VVGQWPVCGTYGLAWTLNLVSTYSERFDVTLDEGKKINARNFALGLTISRWKAFGTEVQNITTRPEDLTPFQVLHYLVQCCY